MHIYLNHKAEGFGDHPADLARDVDIPHFSFFVALFLLLCEKERHTLQVLILLLQSNLAGRHFANQSLQMMMTDRI